MKKLLISTLILLSTGLLAGTQDFTLINHSGSTIQYLYVKMTNTGRNGAWGNDILGSDVLRTRQRIPISFEGNQECQWDIQVKFEDGNTFVFWNQNLCSISNIEVLPDHHSGTASNNSSRPHAVIQNPPGNSSRPQATIVNPNQPTATGSARVESIETADGTSAFSAGGKDFSLINRTGKTIMYMYVSATTVNSWGEDILGSNQTLGNNMRVNIRMGEVN